MNQTHQQMLPPALDLSDETKQAYAQAYGGEPAFPLLPDQVLRDLGIGIGEYYTLAEKYVPRDKQGNKIAGIPAFWLHRILSELKAAGIDYNIVPIPLYLQVSGGYQSGNRQVPLSVQGIMPGIGWHRAVAQKSGRYRGGYFRYSEETGQIPFMKTVWVNGQRQQQQEAVRVYHWVQFVVRKVVGGMVENFEGPKIHGKEAFNAKSNSWQEQPIQMLAKTAEARALKMHFSGHDPAFTPEEMATAALPVAQQLGMAAIENAPEGYGKTFDESQGAQEIAQELDEAINEGEATYAPTQHQDGGFPAGAPVAQEPQDSPQGMPAANHGAPMPLTQQLQNQAPPAAPQPAPQQAPAQAAAPSPAPAQAQSPAPQPAPQNGNGGNQYAEAKQGSQSPPSPMPEGLGDFS